MAGWLQNDYCMFEVKNQFWFSWNEYKVTKYGRIVRDES